MAEFKLPKNSEVKEGKTVDASNGAKRTKTFKIYRFDPDLVAVALIIIKL